MLAPAGAASCGPSAPPSASARSPTTRRTHIGISPRPTPRRASLATARRGGDALAAPLHPSARPEAQTTTLNTTDDPADHSITPPHHPHMQTTRTKPRTPRRTRTHRKPTNPAPPPLTQADAATLTNFRINAYAVLVAQMNDPKVDPKIRIRAATMFLQNTASLADPKDERYRMAVQALNHSTEKVNLESRIEELTRKLATYEPDNAPGQPTPLTHPKPHART